MKEVIFSQINFGSLVLFCLIFIQSIVASEINFPLEHEKFPLLQKPSTNTEVNDEIRPNKLYVRRLKGGEKHVFTFRAKPGNCFRFIFEQKGVDIMITLKDSQGNFIKKIDRPSGSYGRETFTFVSQNVGSYQLEIETWLSEAIEEKYQFSFVKLDLPTKNDLLRIEAEKLVSKAEILRGEGTKESKEKAILVFKEALKKWEKLGDKYEQAIVYYGIGFSNYGLSNHYEAAMLFNRAIKINKEIGEEFGQAINYSALGSIHYVLNNNELSAYYYKNTIEIYQKIANARGLGIAFHGIGTQQLLSEQYNEAIKSLSESLRWRVLANDSSGNARTHITFAKLYLLKQDYKKTEKHLIKAKQTLGNKRASASAELKFYFGRLYFLRDNFNKSYKFLKDSEKLSRKTGNKLGTALTLVELSRTYAKLNYFQKGLKKIKEAVRLIEEIRRSTLNFRKRVEFSATIQPFYEQYISLLMQMHEREPSKKFNELALEISEQARARGLLDKLERRNLMSRNFISPTLLNKEQELLDKLTTYLSRKSELSENKQTDVFFELSNEYAKVEAEINRKFTSAENEFLPTLRFEDISRYIKKDEVLLEYWITNKESFLFFLKDKKLKTFRLDDGEHVEILAQKVFDCISKPPTLITEKDCRLKNFELSNILLNPIKNEVENKRLIVVKKGLLNYIPFASLHNPKTKDYLIKTNEIVSLPSISILKYLNQTAKVKFKKTLAIFADPIYSATDERIVDNKTSNQESDVYLPRLFSSRFEAKAIASFVRTNSLLMKSDADASRENLFKSNLKDYQIIHFATHTLVDNKTPELSAIVLSRYDKNGNSTDGFLRVNDILRLNLTADLVVLSSCRSGAGKQVKGEGLLSLSNSFFANGTRHLLASLWEVDDKATAELMKKFYQKHLKEKKLISTAIREAQIETMQDPRWKSPYHWSAFILQGSYQNILEFSLK